MRRQLLFGVITPLIVGAVLYLLFRPVTIILFELAERLSLQEIIERLRVTAQTGIVKMPNWIIYNLPDGLWSFALTTSLLSHWDNKFNRQNIGWIILPLVLGIWIELFQKCKLISGTFDWLDIIAYFIGTVMPITFYVDNAFYKIKLIRK